MNKSKIEDGLGFRDFLNFNVAMLAKQSLKILQNPNSLRAKFFKQKYFPNSNFLQAKIGSRAFLVWKSFMDGQSLMKKALTWRIGNR